MIELDRAIYFEDDTGISQGLREIMFKEHLVFIPMPIAFASISSSVVDQHLISTSYDEPIEDVDPVVMDIPLRRLERPRRLAILDDYIIYLQEHEYDVSDAPDLTTYKETIVSPQSNF